MKLKHRILRWLIREIEATKKMINHTRKCEIGENSTIAAEGKIENNLGDPTAIKVGANCFVRGQLLTYGHGGRLSVGDWCYIGEGTKIWSMEGISIGDRVLISHNVNIHDGSAHSMNDGERHDHFKRILTQGHPRTPQQAPGLKSKCIVIEDDAWINFGVTILKGVTIGKGAIIAAGSIVTSDVPPYTIYRNKVSPILTPISV